ncbi:hypothetical protein [Encephalitozoon cuniculi GB-M1]|uniref:Uncharacterized protein n=1 Tax=Encephalitozoon cuniculi (strain GB-M1) TaxID=284813 RepID=Q8SW08_ENCCU|nr:uncharacterized protein ECU03_1340 [Encephalitozoon cuniculi GB-M1]CAD26277.1 hypothetical protein [Encephalitozoon cuniculi GB-M1]
MNGNVLGTLGIPLRLVFEGEFDVEMQAKAVKRIEEKTAFRLKESKDMDVLMHETVNDVSSTMDILRNALGKGLFGERFAFLDMVDVFVCHEKISVDEMSRHYVSIDEVMGEEIEEVFRRIVDLEGRRRVEKQSSGWSFKSLADVFKSDPENDKRSADGLFLLQRYKEAYKIYSGYRGDDEFSWYCIEMSVYCLLLSKRPVPRGILSYLRPLQPAHICLIRLMSIVVDLRSVLALEMLSLLLLGSPFRAFAQEALALALDGKGYCRKRIGLWFDSALEFHRMGFLDRSARCCERFLTLTNPIFSEKNLSSLTRNALVCSNRYIKETLESLERSDGPDPEDKHARSDRDGVVVYRKYGGSKCDFQGSVNVIESVFAEYHSKGLVSVLRIGDSTPRVFRTEKGITFEGPGRFVIDHGIFNIGGVERRIEIGIPLDVREDVPFMHVETDDVCEVLCGELYSLSCKAIRNHSSSIRVYFDDREFTTERNIFSLEMVFPSVGTYDRRVILSACGCTAYRDVRFVVIPSFSIDIFNYKYCLPLLFLNIESHLPRDSKVRSCLALNKSLEVSGVDSVEPADSYEKNAIGYFRRNIVGTNGNGLDELAMVRKEDPTLSKDPQQLLQAVEKSPPAVSDLLFSDLMPSTRSETTILGKSVCSSRVFLKAKVPLKTLLNPRDEDSSRMGEDASPVDKVLLPRLGFKMASRSSEGMRGALVDGFQAHEMAMKIEIEVPPRRICTFILEGVLGALLSGPEDRSDGSTPRSMNPFVYITHFSPIWLNEPAIMYLCVSNYYKDHALDVEVSSPVIAICSEDAAFSVEELSFSLFEIRSVFKERGKYGSDDIRVCVKVGSEEVDHECLVELPFVS